MTKSPKPATKLLLARPAGRTYQSKNQKYETHELNYDKSQPFFQIMFDLISPSKLLKTRKPQEY